MSVDHDDRLDALWRAEANGEPAFRAHLQTRIRASLARIGAVVEAAESTDRRHQFGVKIGEAFARTDLRRSLDALTDEDRRLLGLGP